MRHLKIFIVFILAVLAVSACRDNSLSPVPFNTITTSFAGYIRETVIKSEFNVFDFKHSSLQYGMEVYDARGGANFESVDLYLTFTDNTPDSVTVNPTPATAEVHFINIPASSFVINPTTGLPHYDLTVSAVDAMTALGLDSTEVAGTDQFNFRQALNLKDGRTYTTTSPGSTAVSNVGLDVLAGPFYGSPFVNFVPVVCPLLPTFGVGDYMYHSVVPGAFGGFFGDDDHIVPLAAVAGSTTQRTILADYIEFGLPKKWILQFSCGTIVFVGGSTGLGCGNGSITLGPPTANGGQDPYDLVDDSVFDVLATDGVTDGGCGFDPIQVEFTLTKQ